MNAEEIQAVLLSVKVAFVAVAASLPIGIYIAYVLARRSFWGKTLLQGIIDLPLVLPPVVTGFLLLYVFSVRGPVGSLLSQFGINIVFTWLGAAVASAIVSFPLLVRSIRSAIQSTDQRLETAARTLGASKWRAFWTITFPLSQSGVWAGCVLAFARSMGEFGATIMVAGNIPGQTQTIPLAIYSAAHRSGGFQNSWRLVFFAILIALLATAIGEFLEQRRTNRVQN